MADEINVKGSESKFRPHPEGQFPAVCVDTINLGERVEQYPGKPARVVHKCAVVFLTGAENPDTGELHDLSAEFTVSMHENAGLRKLLESWRGKSYSEDEAEKGVPLHKLVGVGALVSVEHKKSGSGRTYAKIKSISPLPKQIAKPTLPEYKRPEFWEERKKAYAAEVAKFRGDQEQHDDYAGVGAGEGDDDLPF